MDSQSEKNDFDPLDPLLSEAEWEEPSPEALAELQAQWRLLMSHNAKPRTTSASGGNADPASSPMPVLGAPWAGAKYASHSVVYLCLALVFLISGVAIAVWYRDISSGDRVLGLPSAVATDHEEKKAAFIAKATCEAAVDPVGRITNMVNVEWAKSGPGEPATDEPLPTCLDYVVTGQWLRLDAGYVEITYQSGAKVILQGPAVFEVLPNGGTLAIGKLAGTLDKRAGETQQRGRGKEAESAFVRRVPPLLFAIRTGTIGVADFGATQFGVEVDSRGVTKVHVFQGAAALCSMIDVAGRPYRILEQGHAMQVDSADDGNGPAMHAIPIESGPFVRQIDNMRDAVNPQNK